MKNLDLLIPKAKPVTDRFTWATVTGVTPVRVRLDGETTPLDITPDCLVEVGWLDINRRVWCQVYGRRLLILGQSGKGVYTPPTPPTVDYATYVRTLTYSAATGSSYMPSRDSGVQAGGATWDSTNLRFTVTKLGVYLLTASVPWGSFGNAYRRDLSLQRSDDGSTWVDVASDGSYSSGYVAMNTSSTEIVTQAQIDSPTVGVFFRFRNYQSTTAASTLPGNTRMQVTRVA